MDCIIKKNKEDNMFIVKIHGGSWDDYYTSNKFVTNDEKYAKSYVKKYNRILGAYKDFYKKFTEDRYGSGFESMKDDADSMQYFDRWMTLDNITKAYYEEIEQR